MTNYMDQFRPEGKKLARSSEAPEEPHPAIKKLRELTAEG